MALEAFVNGKKKKTDKKVGETLRFELELVEASDDKSNEFVYPQLVEKKTAKVTFLSKFWVHFLYNNGPSAWKLLRMHAFGGG